MHDLLTRRTIAAGLALAAVAMTACGDRAEAPEYCGLPGAPACQVDRPPCDAAGSVDRNPGDEAVAPSRRLQVRPSGTGPLPYGFNDPAVSLGELSPDADMSLHRAAGATLTRVVLDWGAVEAEPNDFDFSTTDEIYCAALAAGIRPVLSLTGSPPWALDGSGPPCAAAPCTQPPAEENDPVLRRFAELAAIRYPQAAAIEVWNEPNLVSYWPSPDPERYTRLLAAVYAGVKDGAPGTPVVGGALANAPADDPVTGDLGLSAFLQRMVAAGALETMDALSVHLYAIGGLGTAGDLLSPQLTEALRLAAAAPARPVPLWITETGATTLPGAFASPVSEQQQAAELRAIYERLAAEPTVDAVLFHTLIDGPAAIPGGPGFGWFTLEADGSARPKPVVCAFRGLARLTGCPARFALGPASG